MKPIYSWGIAACAVGAGTWAFSSSKPDAPGREVLIKGGRTAINFLPNTLKASRLTVDFTKVKDDENCNSCSLPGFQFKDSDLRFRVIDGKLVRFDEGKISHKGSFKLKTGEKTISADQMTLTPNGNEGDLSLSVDSEKGRFVAFESSAGNFSANDANGVSDVFWHDRDADGDGIFDEPGSIQTIAISTIAPTQSTGNGPSTDPSMSADGSFLSFESLASRAFAARTRRRPPPNIGGMLG